VATVPKRFEFARVACLCSRLNLGVSSMTMFISQILFSWVLLVALHVSALALAGAMFGVSLREVSFGFGKAIFTQGRLTIRVLPVGGFVKFKDTRTELISREESSEVVDAFNHKPGIVQATIPLAGAGVLVLAAALIQPASAVFEVLTGFRQIVAGALGPLSVAQTYIHAAYDLTRSDGFWALFAVLAAKVAAFNLLPFPWTNGGQAVLALLRSDRTATPAWQVRVTQIAIWPFLALVALWALSFCVFLA
jgi:membrane-associated protease RseP (regulator of RpoE activity)